MPAGSGRAGNIASRTRGPGIMETIWGQPERFVDVYYRKYNKNPDSTDWRDWPYFAGDGALQAAMATSGSSAASTTSSTSPVTGSAPRNSSPPR